MKTNHKAPQYGSFITENIFFIQASLFIRVLISFYYLSFRNSWQTVILFYIWQPITYKLIQMESLGSGTIITINDDDDFQEPINTLSLLSISIST